MIVLAMGDQPNGVPWSGRLDGISPKKSVIRRPDPYYVDFMASLSLVTNLGESPGETSVPDLHVAARLDVGLGFHCKISCSS